MEGEKANIFVERTLAIVKPDSIDRYEEIEKHILSHGFNIIQVIYALTSH